MVTTFDSFSSTCLMSSAIPLPDRFTTASFIVHNHVNITSGRSDCRIVSISSSFITWRARLSLYLLTSSTSTPTGWSLTAQMTAYLLLDKPIIYYAFDLKEYLEQCRGFVHPFEEYVAGEMPLTENELFEAVKHIINGQDNFQERRKELRDKFFTYQDGKNCERFVGWIRSLSKKG